MRKKPRKWAKIPKIQLQVERLLEQADGREDIISFDSELRGFGMIGDGENLVICNGSGALVVTRGQLNVIAAEAKDAFEYMAIRARS